MVSAEHELISLTALDRRSVIEDVATAVQARIARAYVTLFAHPYCPGFWEISVQDSDATKANALRKLAAHLDVDLRDVTVFGDNDNDIGMFEVAGHAIAVGNASAMARSKASAVIGTNDEDAVVRAIESLSGGTCPHAGLERQKRRNSQGSRS